MPFTAPTIANSSPLQSSPMNAALANIVANLNNHVGGSAERHLASAMDALSVDETEAIDNINATVQRRLNQFGRAIGIIAGPGTAAWSTKVTGIASGYDLQSIGAIILARSAAATANSLVLRDAYGGTSVNTLNASGPLYSGTAGQQLTDATTGKVLAAALADRSVPFAKIAELAVTQTPTPGMSVNIAIGWYVDSVRVVQRVTAPINVLLPATPTGGNSRYDAIVLTASQVAAVRQGTAAVSPALPTLVAGDVITAVVSYRPSTTAVYTTDQGTAGTGFIIPLHLIPSVAGGSSAGGTFDTSIAFWTSGDYSSVMPNSKNVVGFLKNWLQPDIVAPSRWWVSGTTASYYASAASSMTIAIGGVTRTITANETATAPATGGGIAVMALIVDSNTANPFLSVQAEPLSLSATQKPIAKVFWTGAAFVSPTGFDFSSTADVASIKGNQVGALLVKAAVNTSGTAFTSTAYAAATDFAGVNFSIPTTSKIQVTHRCRCQLSATAGGGYIEGFVFILDQTTGAVYTRMEDTNVGLQNQLGTAATVQGWFNNVGWIYDLPAGRYTLNQYWVVAAATATLFGRSLTAEIKG